MLASSPMGMPGLGLVRELTEDFVRWCLQNHLQINSGKTKELVVDFETSSTYTGEHPGNGH